MMGYQRKVTTSRRCDFCNKIIPVGKVSYEIRSGDAQGTYHGRQCYEAALKKYRELQNKLNVENGQE